MVVRKLAISNFRVHKIRLALTLTAIALSVSLVIAVTSGYASARASAQKMLALYMGTTDAQITRPNQARGGIRESLIEQIAQDPDVERVDGRLEIENGLMTNASLPLIGRAAQLVGINRPSDTRVESLGMEAGDWFDRPDSEEAVIDQVAQKRLNVHIGETFIIPGIDRKLTLRVTGVVHKPGILAQAMQTIYLPLRTLQEFALPDDPRQVSRIMIDLNTGVDHHAFQQRWAKRLEEIDPLLRIQLSSDARRQMDQNLQGLQALSYLGGSVSMLAAAFIVFSTLSMGVAERQRTLAMLRAIGAYRSQLGWLVVWEGLLLALVGVIAGIPIGVLWVKLLAWKYDFLFTAGGVVSAAGLIFASVGAVFTAVVASLLPAVNAMRASPLDAMTPLSRPASGIGMVLSAVAGLLLVCVDPLILFLPLNRSFQFYAHFTIGLAGIMIGCFLLAPLLVWILQRVLGPMVAAMVGVRYEVLRQQLSGGIWRAAGTCAALMVGLSILVATQTQGVSAIQGWTIPDRFPDIFIFAPPPGLNPAQQEKLAQVPGIRPGQLMPIAVASPQFGTGIFAIASLALMPDATMFFGVDPDQALDMMELDFRDGNPADAKRMLKLGRHIIVTQDFRQLKGIGVGDTVPLKTRKGTIDFTVAGVVWSPGIDVITSMQDLGKQFDQRTVASIFGTLDDAREHFGVERIYLFAANLEHHVEKADLLAQVKSRLGELGLDAGDVRQIKYNIQKALGRLLMLVSTVAYAAMGLASLGVTNTIMASIRSRRWHFGILRSIGVTRSQLLRLVLAEAVLLGIAGVALGLLAGAMLAIDARRSGAIFVGYLPPVVIPWGTISIGVGVVMVVSLLASLWPAVHVARSQPLALLQAGRAAV